MKKLYFFVIFLVLYEFSTYASNDMIMPGMLAVVTEFHASVEFIGLSLMIYILGNTALQLFLGPLAEHFGKRNVILIGNLLFLLFTFFLVLSHNIYEFMTARLFQGTGLAFIAMGYALIHENFDDKQAVKITSLMANVSLLAPLIGPILGVFIIHVAGWRSIFAITGFMAIISFVGLYLYTPASKTAPIKLSQQRIIKTYFLILRKPPFIMGILCVSLSALPLLCWIGLSPTLIMQTLKLPMMSYALYQLVAIGGLAFSSIVIQLIAGKMSFYRLLKISSVLVLIGLMECLIFHDNLTFIAMGMFVYSFGFGIFNSLSMRLVMTTPNVPQNMLTSLMVFIHTAILALGIAVANKISDYFNYSFYSFTLICVFIGCIFMLFAFFYARMNKNRTWN